MKRVTSAITAAALALAVSATPSVADKDSDTIAGILALGLLGAAIAHDQKKKGNATYAPHNKVNAEENAVGSCMHRAERLVKKAGGYGVHLEKVNSIITGNDGRVSVSMVATGYYSVGQKTSDVACTVKNNKVTSFVFN